MSDIKKTGFDTWLIDKVDPSKTASPCQIYNLWSYRLAKNSFEGSFLSDGEKSKMLNRVDEFYMNQK